MQNAKTQTNVVVNCTKRFDATVKAFNQQAKQAGGQFDA